MRLFALMTRTGTFTLPRSQEYLRFLKKFEIQHDERYLFKQFAMMSAAKSMSSWGETMARGLSGPASGHGLLGAGFKSGQCARAVRVADGCAHIGAPGATGH